MGTGNPVPPHDSLSSTIEINGPSGPIGITYDPIVSGEIIYTEASEFLLAD
jgi:hypothetical protein